MDRLRSEDSWTLFRKASSSRRRFSSGLVVSSSCPIFEAESCLDCGGVGALWLASVLPSLAGSSPLRSFFNSKSLAWSASDSCFFCCTLSRLGNSRLRSATHAAISASFVSLIMRPLCSRVIGPSLEPADLDCVSIHASSPSSSSDSLLY